MRHSTTSPRRRPSSAVRLFYYDPFPEEYHAPWVIDRAAVPIDLAGLALDFAARSLLHLANSAIRALHRAYATREATTTASLLGAPSPAAVAAAFTPSPRPLRQALLAGSKLADLAATRPDTRLRDAGGTRFAGRAGGLKQYLADTCPAVPYSTAMRYKKLAQRTRQALTLPPALPLEWLLTDEKPSSLTADSALLRAIVQGRRDLSSLLSATPTQRALSRTLEQRLGLARAPLLRDAAAPARRRASPYDLASAAATLDRYAETLHARVASGAPLTRPEKRALKLLSTLRAALR